MSLVKAMIINTITGSPIPILFNPEEYSISRSAKFSDAKVPGLEVPITEYSHGLQETLSMDLFFDTYELDIDVRIFTERVAKLLDLDPGTDAPPVCLFVWGTLVFECQLENLTKRFTMFNSFGIPVRATLSVTFRGHNKLEYLLAKNPFRSLGHLKTYLVKQGETLSQIAWNVFQDSAQWRKIADFNKITNPRKLEPGQVLLIPPS
jgi:hypothetical protein